MKILLKKNKILKMNFKCLKQICTFLNKKYHQLPQIINKNNLPNSKKKLKKMTMRMKIK